VAIAPEVAMSADPVGPGAVIVGWREWLALPEIGIRIVRAKIDTGARSSALHVERWEDFRRDGVRWVRYELKPTSRRRAAVVRESPVVDERHVTDTGGNRTLRPFIRTRVVIGEASWEIEMNLTNRRGMLFPMLLGRTAMAGRLLVDPARSWVLGRPHHVHARHLPASP
jgi:hypothetical protein